MTTRKNSILPVSYLCKREQNIIIIFSKFSKSYIFTNNTLCIWNDPIVDSAWTPGVCCGGGGCCC